MSLKYGLLVHVLFTSRRQQRPRAQCVASKAVAFFMLLRAANSLVVYCQDS